MNNGYLLFHISLDVIFFKIKLIILLNLHNLKLFLNITKPVFHKVLVSIEKIFSLQPFYK